MRNVCQWRVFKGINKNNANTQSWNDYRCCLTLWKKWQYSKFKLKATTSFSPSNCSMSASWVRWPNEQLEAVSITPPYIYSSVCFIDVRSTLKEDKDDTKVIKAFYPSNYQVILLHQWKQELWVKSKRIPPPLSANHLYLLIISLGLDPDYPPFGTSSGHILQSR